MAHSVDRSYSQTHIYKNRKKPRTVSVMVTYVPYTNTKPRELAWRRYKTEGIRYA